MFRVCEFNSRLRSRFTTTISEETPTEWPTKIYVFYPGSQFYFYRNTGSAINLYRLQRLHKLGEEFSE